MNILLLGGSGQLGREILLQTPPRVRVAAPGRDELDLTAPDGLDALLDSQPFDVVINAAAYTAVDRAEKERDRAFAINAEAPRRLAAAAAREGVPVLHVSTDYVDRKSVV